MTARQALMGRDAWLGKDMANSMVWIRELSPAALTEIDAALRGVQNRGQPWREIKRENFPLPRR